MNADSVRLVKDRSISDLLRLLRAHKLYIFLSIGIATSVALAIAFLLPKQYRAEVLLQPVQAEGQLGAGLAGLGSIAGLVGLQLGNLDHSAEAQAVLESKSFTMNFVRKYNLLPVLYSDLWDSKTRHWKVDDARDVPSELDAYRMFKNDIRTVTQDRQTRLVQIAILWKDPRLAAEWANTMIVELNKKMQHEARERAIKNIEFLQRESEKTDVAVVRETISRVMESEMKTAMLASVQDDYAFRVIDPAVVPNRRVAPKRTLIVITGFLLGLGFGITLAVLRERSGSLPVPSR